MTQVNYVIWFHSFETLVFRYWVTDTVARPVEATNTDDFLIMTDICTVKESYYSLVLTPGWYCACSHNLVVLYINQVHLHLHALQANFLTSVYQKSGLLCILSTKLWQLTIRISWNNQQTVSSWEVCVSCHFDGHMISSTFPVIHTKGVVFWMCRGSQLCWCTWSKAW